MSERRFALLPFEPFCSGLRLEVTAGITRDAGRLAACFALHGELEDLIVPTRVGAPARRGRLWEETCLELFLAVRGTSEYREFNLSPAGHWNVYRFDGYRRGMREEPAFPSLPFQTSIEQAMLRLDVVVGLDRIVRPDDALEVGVSAVLRHRNGYRTYWALTHRGPRPDFHRRECFIAEM